MKSSELRAKRIEMTDRHVRIAIAGRASYFNGLSPVADDDEKPDVKKYKTSILLPKDSPTEHKAVLVEAIRDAVRIGIQKKWGGVKPENLQLPRRDGDIKAKEAPDKYEAYAGCWHMTAKRGLEYGPPRLRANRKDVTEAGIIESGDWCIFDINLYPFKNKQKGIAVALNGVTLIEEGERFGGGPSNDSIDSEAEDLYGDLLGAAGGDDLLGDDDLLGGNDLLGDDDLADLL